MKMNLSPRRELDYYMNLPYRMKVIPEEDGSGYTVTIPDLKGCLAFGDSLEEALEMITEAKELWIETALENGWPIPEPSVDEPKHYSGKFNVRLPRFLHRRLAELAESEGTSLNQLVLAFLSEGAERHHQKRRLEHLQEIWSVQWTELTNWQCPRPSRRQAELPAKEWAQAFSTILWLEPVGGKTWQTLCQ